MRIATTVLATLFIIGGVSAAAPCGAHGDRSTMLVSTSWLAGHLKDANLVILAIGQKKDYDAGHIPGSVHLPYEEIQAPRVPGSLTTELPPMADLAATFAKYGVTNDSRIVIYPLTEGVTPSARVYVTLDAMGLGAQTGILNGGFPLWTAEKRPSTTDVPVVKPGKVAPCPQNDVIADLDYVRANMKHAGVAIIDSRAPEFYTGERVPQGRRAGHIPGAANVAFSSVVDEKNVFKSADALQALFRDAGVKQGDRVVTYCHIGQQASLVYFTARYLGFDARMYDGSWEDWSAHTELPTETGAK